MEFLTQLGVKVRLNTLVTDFDGEYVRMNDGETIRARKLIWAAGITGNKLKGMPDASLTHGNRIKVNRFNQVEGIEDVYAIGDIAYMEEEAYPQGHPQVAQVAMQQAVCLADNLSNLHRGRELTPFSYKDLGSMATIGRNRAVADLPGFKFQGAFAWLIWLFVHLFQILGVKNKVFIFLNWVWNYVTYDQSLRLIIRPRVPKSGEVEVES